MVEIVEIWDLMLVEFSKTRKQWNGPNRRKEQPLSLFYNSEINLQNLDQISQILTFQTVTISFPSASEEEDHDQIMASSAIKTPHRRLLEAQFHVLAVDDSPLDRKLIEKLLQISSYQVTTVDSGIKALQFLGLHEDEEMGGENDLTVLPEKLFTASSYQVTTVDSGVNALELLGLQEDEEKRGENDHTVLSETHHQDIGVSLIITDYCMPEMTGYDLLRKIKQSKSMKDTPVVIMSSEDNPSRINRCLEEGAEEFILKPVKMGDVRKLRPIVLRGRDKENVDGNNTGQPQMSDTTNMHRNV